MLPPKAGEGEASIPLGPAPILAYRAWLRTRTGGGDVGGAYIAARGASAVGWVSGANRARNVSVVLVAVLSSDVSAIRRAEVAAEGARGEEP